MYGKERNIKPRSSANRCHLFSCRLHSNSYVSYVTTILSILLKAPERRQVFPLTTQMSYQVIHPLNLRHQIFSPFFQNIRKVCLKSLSIQLARFTDPCVGPFSG